MDKYGVKKDRQYLSDEGHFQRILSEYDDNELEFCVEWWLNS